MGKAGEELTTALGLMEVWSVGEKGKTQIIDCHYQIRCLTTLSFVLEAEIRLCTC